MVDCTSKGDAVIAGIARSKHSTESTVWVASVWQRQTLRWQRLQRLMQLQEAGCFGLVVGRPGMALGYAWFDSYDSVGYVLTLHISPPTVCPYLPIAKRAFFFCRVANFNALGRDVLW